MNINNKGNKTELTREVIMGVARELLVEKGYANVSMRQIANKINCSHGAIYYHFKNKAELFYALVEDHFSIRSEEHTSELQSRGHLVCRLLLEKKKKKTVKKLRPYEIKRVWHEGEQRP